MHPDCVEMAIRMEAIVIAFGIWVLEVAVTLAARRLWSVLPNGCLQQIAANRFSIPQDFIAILLQGFVRRLQLDGASRLVSA
jgi:hypothetical protein